MPTSPIVIQSQSSRLNVDETEIHKMRFIMNALERGWSVKKRNNSYIFSKKHEGKREVFRDNYLETFIYENLDT
jgi:hypothetical protein